MNSKKVYSLYQLSKSISNLFRGHASQTYWVKAEILKLNFYEQSGHAYPDLVDKQNATLRAKFSGTIWKPNFNAINEKFRIIGETLKDNMTIVAKVNINYHGVHGLSLNILDIDSDYTQGELARQKQQAIRKLKDEKLFDLNQRTLLSLIPKTIAVISVQSSKGYSDFVDILANNPKGFQFHYKLFPAILQGERAISSISKQLQILELHQSLFDAVAIIRGGGDEVGFSAYDDYKLAKNIAQCSIPVLTGIGHSTNRTVSELVSYKSFITPTKLAEFLVEQFDTVEQNLNINLTSLEKNALNRINLNNSQLQNISKLFEVFTSNNLSRQIAMLTHLEAELIRNSKSQMANEIKQLEFFQQELKLLDPIQTLKRGFSITKIKGKAILDTNTIKEGDKVQTKFYKGEIDSTVNNISNT